MVSHPRALVLLAAVCFGTSGTAQALGPSGAPPAGVGAARILVGALLLWAAASWLGRRTVGVHASARPPERLAWLAGIGVAVYQLSFFAAVNRTGVALGTVVAIGSGPAAAGLLGRLVNGEPLTRRWALATALACAGIAMLGLGGGGGSGDEIDSLGIALAVIAGVGYASYTVLAKRALDAGAAPERVMSAAFGRGAVLLLPVLPIAGIAWLGEAGGIVTALYLGLVPTAIAYVLFARGLRRLGAGEVATLTLAEPLTAAVLGAVVLSERPSALGAAGALVVLAGLLVLALPGTQASRAVVAAEAQG